MGNEFEGATARRALGNRSFRRRARLIEAGAFLGACAWLIYQLRDLLFVDRLVIAHDNVVWGLPLFAYFADGVLHGHIPLWNPFSHGGEPFLPALLQDRLLDPLLIIVVWVGNRFTDDLLILYNWYWLARCVTASLGIYLLVRRWARNPFTKAALAVVAVLSSTTLSAIHQEGLLTLFYCAPLMLLFLFRLLEGRHGLSNWAGVAFFAGQSFQSYSFVGSATAIVAIILGYLAFERAALWALVSSWQNLVRAVVCLGLIGVMSAPNVVAYATQSDYQIAARDVPANWQAMLPLGRPVHQELGAEERADTMLRMPYGVIRLTGTFSRVADFLGLLAPPSFLIEGPINSDRDKVSEAYLFIGAFPFALALVGIFCGRARSKKIWLLVLAAFGLIILGANTPIHWLLYQIYPPFWFMRHTALLSSFFLLALIYFFVLGADRVLAVRLPLPRRGTARRATGALHARWLIVPAMLALGVAVALATELATLFPPLPVGQFRVDWLAITLLVIASVLLARIVGSIALVAVLSGMIVAALINAPHREAEALWIAGFLLVPGTLFFLIRRGRHRWQKPVAGHILLLVVLVELGAYAAKISADEALPRGYAAKDWPLKVGGPAFPQTRMPTIPDPPYPSDTVRNPGLLVRAGTVFDTPLSYPSQRFANDTRVLLAAGRTESLATLVSYGRLVHSGLDADVIAAIFGIGAPIIQFRTRATVVDDFVSTMKSVPPPAAVAALADTVFIDSATLPGRQLPFPAPGKGASGDISAVEFGYDRVLLHIATDLPGFLYFADAYTADWIATINGKSTTVLRANGGFKALAVEPVPALRGGSFGTSIVQLSYQPKQVIASIRLFYGGLALAVLLGLAGLPWAARRS